MSLKQIVANEKVVIHVFYRDSGIYMLNKLLISLCINRKVFNLFRGQLARALLRSPGERNVSKPM